MLVGWMMMGFEWWDCNRMFASVGDRGKINRTDGKQEVKKQADRGLTKGPPTSQYLLNGFITE